MKDKNGKTIYEPYRIKVLNTINFKKSMKYNPFAYIHSEKDILKLVTTLIANTKGEGKAGDDFWVKAETLLYCALIGYIHYEAPVEEQNFSTLIEFIKQSENGSGHPFGKAHDRGGANRLYPARPDRAGHPLCAAGAIGTPGRGVNTSPILVAPC